MVSHLDKSTGKCHLAIDPERADSLDENLPRLCSNYLFPKTWYFLKTRKKINYNKLINSFKNNINIVLKDDLENHIYPTTLDVYNNDLVYVGRIRVIKNRNLLLYLTANNLLTGAASNAVKICEEIIKKG